MSLNVLFWDHIWQFSRLIPDYTLKDSFLEVLSEQYELLALESGFTMYKAIV